MKPQLLPQTLRQHQRQQSAPHQSEQGNVFSLFRSNGAAAPPLSGAPPSLTAGGNSPRDAGSVSPRSSSNGVPRSPRQPGTEFPSIGTPPATVGGQWRSALLLLEVRLKELVADGPMEPPSIPRIEEVLKIFDQFTALMTTPAHGEMLRLLRVEFCRAIFSGAASATSNNDTSQVPFFDKIDKMLRERNILQAELEAAETDNNVADLKRQITKLSALLPFYEQEIGRLTRETERQQDDISHLRQEIDANQIAHEKAYRILEDESRKLTTENRELQLQVFRLSKDNREQLTSQSMYQHLKQQKGDRAQALFSKGDEESGLTLTCHQLENALNGILMDFDLEFGKATVNEVASIRVKLFKKVSLILEEMHFCENRLMELTAQNSTPETAKFVSVLKASSLYELEVAKFNRTKELVAAAAHHSSPSRKKGPKRQSVTQGGLTVPRGPGGATPNTEALMSQSITMGANPTPPPGENINIGPPGGTFPSSDDILQQKRNEWVKRFLGSVVEHRDLYSANAPTSQKVATPATKKDQDLLLGEEPPLLPSLTSMFPHHTWNTSGLLQRMVMYPLLDVSSNKFMCGIDIAAYSAGTTSHVKTVNYIDPTGLVDIPAKTTHIKLKYVNPLMRPATTSVDEATLNDIEQQAMTTAMEWSPQTQKANQRALLEDQQRIKPTAASGTISPTTGDVQGHWRLYRRLFRDYKPYLPRVLEIYQLDFVMYQVCQRHASRMMMRYDACRNIATQRSTNAQMTKVLAERLFRDEYQTGLEFQVSLVEVLEGRYGFPELVAKSMYEVLVSLEACVPSAPHAQAYLDCISGAQGFSCSFLTSMILHAITSFWPVNLNNIDEIVNQKDVNSVFRYIYPNEATVRVDLDQLMSEMLLSCQDRITLRACRLFASMSVAHGEEPVVKKVHELLAYRAEVVQWNELEFADTFEILKNLVAEEVAGNSIAFFLESCCILGKASRLPLGELSFLGATLVASQSMKVRRM